MDIHVAESRQPPPPVSHPCSAMPQSCHWESLNSARFQRGLQISSDKKVPCQYRPDSLRCLRDCLPDDCRNTLLLHIAQRKAPHFEPLHLRSTRAQYNPPPAEKVLPKTRLGARKLR